MELVLESEEATSVAKDDGTGTVGEASCDLSTMNKDFLGIGAIEDKSKTPSLSLRALATCCGTLRRFSIGTVSPQ